MLPTTMAQRANPIRLAVIALALFLSTLLAGCAPEANPELKLAVNPWPGYTYFAVAEENGFVAEAEGLELEIVETASLSDSLRAFERGQVDLIGGTLAELSDINSHGKRPARAILVLNRSVGGDMIVATSGIRRLEDLAGKRVALEPASANVLVLAAAAKRSGLDLDQVTLLPLPQGEMPAALDKGQFDAAVTYPPIAQELLARPGTHRLFDTSQAPDAVIDVLIAAVDVIETRPRTLRQLVRAHERALAWSRENPEAARRILARHTGLSPEELASLEEAIEMLSVEEQRSLWTPDGPLASALTGASDVLARLHDREPAAAEAIPDMLDGSFVGEGPR